MKRIFKNFLLIGIVAAMFTACGDSDENDNENGGANGAVSIANGVIKAPFSVSADKKVYFSTGNLQYQASTNTWRFAEHQYDVIGSSNAKISSTYDGWIDWLSWGTSGWDSGANVYQPYVVSKDDADFYPGGSFSNSLTGSYANADWGVFNKISNGGNKAGQWRTLTTDEWQYLLSGRPNARILVAHGSVDYKNGLILLPDGWDSPSGFSLNISEPYYGTNYIANRFSLEDWAIMESHGAVFLPASGYREGNYSQSSSESGNYWSSTAHGKSYAYQLDFDKGSKDPKHTTHRSYGIQVRLVQDVK